jgi:hypothetical protein
MSTRETDAPNRSATRLALVAASIVAASAWVMARQAVAPAAVSDLDAFMARVLERRNENWRALHDYILSEREQFEITGPSAQRLYGTRREFTWFVRDGYLIRSPLRFDGVAPDDRSRQDYEIRWLREEQSREKQEAEKAKNAREKASREAHAEVAGEATSADDSVTLVQQGVEPRFISEAYFMRFRFDPGNYYLAGRETMDGRPVLRIEYYPTRLFSSDSEERDERRPDRKNEKADRREDEFERKFNKVALVTLWVDPVEHQIVKYTFENTDLNFLPGRWLLRVSDISASMTMGQYFQRVWLPRNISVHASLTLANGIYDAVYGRDFFDYRQGEVKAKIRSYAPEEQ